MVKHINRLFMNSMVRCILVSVFCGIVMPALSIRAVGQDVEPILYMVPSVENVSSTSASPSGNPFKVELSDGYSFTFKGFYSISLVQKEKAVTFGLGTKESTPTIATDFAFAQKINKVTIEIRNFVDVTTSKYKLSAANLYVCDSPTNMSNPDVYTCDVSKFVNTVGKEQTIAFDITKPQADKYYIIELSMPATVNRQMGVVDVKYYADDECVFTTSAPEFTVPSSTNMAEGQEISFADVDADTKIYYTTDGSEPTVNSSIYNSPILFTGQYMVVNAIAKKYSYNKSNIVTATYQSSVTGIDGVENDEDSPAEYFNLQGIKVFKNNLSRGYYIRRTGRETRMVYCGE